MANTVIQLKYSNTPGNSPVSLANGEVAINQADGKLFYANTTGAVKSIVTYPGPSGLNTEVQFNDSGVMGTSANLSFNKTTGTLTTHILSLDGLNSQSTNTITTNSVTQTTLLSFPVASYGSGKFLIQATAGSSRHITEVLMVTNGTTVDATEYGTVTTGVSLFTVEVGVVSSNATLYITSSSSASTVYKTSFILVAA